MSLLSDIKLLIKKYIKNPVLVIAGAYILWKFINAQRKKENFCESVRIVKEIGGNSIIFDEKTKKYVLMKGRS